MSRSLKFTKNTKSAMNGQPNGEVVLVKDFDFATAGAITNFNVHDEFSMGAHNVSVQAIFKNLTGVLDGTIDLTQSNDGENFDLMTVQKTLDTANGSQTLERVDYSGKFLGLRLSKIGITGGTVTLIMVVKHH